LNFREAPMKFKNNKRKDDQEVGVNRQVVDNSEKDLR
jgi:hypothetical protein